MGAQRLDSKLYERIVTERFVFGKPLDQISKDTEKGLTSIQNVVYAFESVRDDDLDRATNMIVKASVPLSLFEWAYEKLGKTMPKALEEAYANRKSKNPATAAKRAEEQAPEAPPAAIDHWGEEKLLLQTMIVEQKKTNELLEQLFDVVFPKWVGDIKDNINANSDVMNQTLKRIEDKAEAIRINIRKRGM